MTSICNGRAGPLEFPARSTKLPVAEIHNLLR